MKKGGSMPFFLFERILFFGKVLRCRSLGCCVKLFRRKKSRGLKGILCGLEACGRKGCFRVREEAGEAFRWRFFFWEKEVCKLIFKTKKR